MSRRGGAADLDRPWPAGWVCSTITTASAPRGSGPPVAIDVAVPDSTGRVGAVPQAMTLVVQLDADRGCLAGGCEIGRAHRKAVDIGAIKWRHVDRRHDILRQRAAERIRELTLLARNGARKQRRLKPRQRILTRQDGQELVLIRGSRVFGKGAFAISESLSVPQHIGIDRRARSKALGAAGHREPGVSAGDGRRARAHPWPAATIGRRSFRAEPVRSYPRGGNLAGQRQGDGLPLRRKPRQSLQHRKHQCPPHRQRLIRRARQRDDGNVPDPADGGGVAGLQGDAMRDDLATPSQRRDRLRRCGRRRCRPS